jgi:hypothetical protein
LITDSTNISWVCSIIRSRRRPCSELSYPFPVPASSR